MIKFIIIAIILIVILILIKNILTLKELDLKIDACSGSLFEVLDAKKDLMVKIIGSSKNKNNKTLLDNINTDDLFEYEETLYNVFNTLKKDKTITKKGQENFKEIKKETEEIDGLKDFYNTNVNKFNALYDKKVLSFIYKLFKLEKKDLFPDRNESDLNILKD